MPLCLSGKLVPSYQDPNSYISCNLYWYNLLSEVLINIDKFKDPINFWFCRSPWYLQVDINDKRRIVYLKDWYGTTSSAVNYSVSRGSLTLVLVLGCMEYTVSHIIHNSAVLRVKACAHSNGSSLHLAYLTYFRLSLYYKSSDFLTAGLQ